MGDTKVRLTLRQRAFLVAAAARDAEEFPIVRRAVMASWRASNAWSVGGEAFTQITGDALEHLRLIEKIPAAPGSAATMKVRGGPRGVTIGYAYRITATGLTAIQKDA